MTTSLAGTLKTAANRLSNACLAMVPATGCVSARSRRSRFLEAATRKASDVIEISPGWNRYWLAMWPNYRSVDLPAFDIYKDRTE